MPEDTIFPSSQRRSQEMTLPQLILWKSHNKNTLISQLKFRHLMKAFTIMTPLRTHPWYTVVNTTNMGYPWLVLLLVVCNTALLHSMMRMIILKTTNTGYPCLALLLPLHTNVPTLSKRTLVTKKRMVNVGYPWLTI
jgi:hypothetical protein